MSVVTAFPLNACFTVAIPFLRALGVPLARGTLLFYSSAPCRVAALRFRVWSEATTARFDKFVKAACEKKADRLAIALKDPRKSQCSAAGWWVAHSLTAGAAPLMRARSLYFALGFFALEPGPSSWVHPDRFWIPDSVRLALPRPPNLDSKYQRMIIFCQEKNAKCG
jgi:hypothetical protein